MNLDEFSTILKKRSITHKFASGSVIVTQAGSVYLDSLTTLPEGVKFENQGSVSLDSLTTLPEGVKFENQGYVYLDSLTTLPEGVKFENHGYVSLYSLTTLPEGVKFENQGSVYLNSLTTLPEGVKFENQGYVYLGSLTTLPEGVKFENQGSVSLNSLTTLPEGVKFENQGYVYLGSVEGDHTYLGKKRTFKTVDGATMILGSSKAYGGYTVRSARSFSGGEFSQMRKCYIAESDGLTAHGDSMKSAVEDLQYKVANTADQRALAEEVRKTGKVTLAQFRGITGACREGIRAHLAGIGIDLSEISEMPLEDAMSAMSGTSFGDTFKSHVEAVS